MNDSQQTDVRNAIRKAMSAVDELLTLIEDEERVPRDDTRTMVMVQDALVHVDNANDALSGVARAFRFDPVVLRHVDP